MTDETKEPTATPAGKAFETTWFHRHEGDPFVKRERKDKSSPLILRNWHLVVGDTMPMNEAATNLEKIVAEAKVEAEAANALALPGTPFGEAVESMLRLVPLSGKVDAGIVAQRQRIVCSLGVDLARALSRVDSGSFAFRSFDGDHIRLVANHAGDTGHGCRMGFTTRVVVDFLICPLLRMGLVSHCYVRNPRDKREVAEVAAITRKYAETCRNRMMTKGCFAATVAHFLILATKGTTQYQDGGGESKDGADWRFPVDMSWDDFLERMADVNKRFQMFVKGSDSGGISPKAVEMIALILSDPSGDKVWQTRMEHVIAVLSS
jgi:hypothetical protein